MQPIRSISFCLLACWLLNCAGTSSTTSFDASSMEPDTTSSPNDPCSAARQAIFAHQYTQWSGQMDSCDWQQLFPDYRLIENLPRRRMGSEFVPTTYIGIPLSGYRTARMSFVGDQWVMFDGMLTDLDSAATQALIEAFGPPAAKLDWYFGTLLQPETEWVYPERGVTLFLRDDLELLLHVALYQSSSLESYLQSRRLDLRKRRR